MIEAGVRGPCRRPPCLGVEGGQTLGREEVQKFVEDVVEQGSVEILQNGIREEEKKGYRERGLMRGLS